MSVIDYPGNYLDGEELGLRTVRAKALVALDLCCLSSYHQTRTWNGFESRISERTLIKLALDLVSEDLGSSPDPTNSWILDLNFSEP